MRQRELEVLGHELLDVRPPQVLRLLQLDQPEDLQSLASSRNQSAERTWIDLKRARWRAAMSAYIDSITAVLDISLYSLYMLCVPERES
jgi:hypothetical protein